MDFSIRRAIAALTVGDDAQRHFDLAAERIQQALLNVQKPAIERLEIGVRAEPARLVGGDYVDLIAMPDGSLLFGLGDASGKSLAAALNAMMLRSLVRGLVSALGSSDLAAIARHANSVVSGDMAEGAFITFVVGSIDTHAGTLRAVNAGHEPPLVLRADAAEVVTMERHGLVLGIDAESAYAEQLIHVAPGDVIVVYTDGLTEATNEQGELFTMERLMQNLAAERTRPAAEIADRLFDTVRRYSSGPLRDDATILVMRVH